MVYTFKLALRAPAAAGLKVMLIRHVAPAARSFVQLSLTHVKSPLLAPVVVMLVKVRVAAPLLEKVTA